MIKLIAKLVLLPFKLVKWILKIIISLAIVILHIGVVVLPFYLLLVKNEISGFQAALIFVAGFLIARLITKVFIEITKKKVSVETHSQLRTAQA